MSDIMISSVYVSHLSDDYINKFALKHKEELGNFVCVVNSSATASKIEESLGFNILDAEKNLGFSAANNLGINFCRINDPDYFLIINPDISLPLGWLLNVKAMINNMQDGNIGIFTVPLLGYSFDDDEPTGLIDSLGISRTWYGRWYDILQGHNVVDLKNNEQPSEVLSSCGALMIIHKDVVSQLLDNDGYVFNEKYFMYKEDIELSIRVRDLGKKILLLPSAPAYHCRGWASNRIDSPYWARLLSARNELKMHLDFYWFFLPYSIVKYLYVKYFEN